jgi:hypothetical protein
MSNLIEQQKIHFGAAFCPTEDGELCTACQNHNKDSKCALDLKVAELIKSSPGLGL